MRRRSHGADVPRCRSLAEVHHVAVAESVTRLYLLEGHNRRVVAIEVSGVPGGTSLEELDSIVDDFGFSRS